MNMPQATMGTEPIKLAEKWTWVATYEMGCDEYYAWPFFGKYNLGKGAMIIDHQSELGKMLWDVHKSKIAEWCIAGRPSPAPRYQLAKRNFDDNGKLCFGFDRIVGRSNSE
jgi:hypothetical protein